ncbi:MAG: SLC13 family permease [Phycisphaerales bacterium]|nr:SLC13 family permease [Phycisphaerales bacterium]
MSSPAWLTAGLIIAMFLLVGSGRFAADAVVLAIVAILLVCGVISPAEALSGFSSSGLVTVACLYIVATGLKETGAIGLIGARMLGRPRSTLAAQANLILPVAGMSAFINNTPIVAMFLPVLHGFARRTGISPSRLFLPLSYAAILGGVCTLIGTSTNVVVAGLIRAHNARAAGGGAAAAPAPIPEMGMFDITAIGLPVAICGVLYMLLFGRLLLPDRRTDPLITENARQYHTAMRVTPDSPIVGKTIEQAGLRHLPGLFLSRIERLDARAGSTQDPRSIIPAPGPAHILQGDDTLVFVGVLESVVDLQKIRGLVPIAEHHADDADAAPPPSSPTNPRPVPRSRLKLVEAVISPASPLVGRSVREGGGGGFRTRYGAVIIAVHRHGQRLPGKIGDIVLRPGDTLLIEADSAFASRYRDSSDFHLVSELEGAAAPRHERATIAAVIFAALLLLLTLGSVGLPGLARRLPDEMTLSMCAALLMVALRCCSTGQARAALDWQVLLVIAGSFGIGRAVESSGLAATVAQSVMRLADGAGTMGVFAAVYILALLFTMLLSNNSAAVLLFPVAVRIAHERQIEPLPLVLCMTVAASCEFVTPIGYQTNLMVMGPGGYRWKDYVRFGGPLTCLCGAIAIPAAWLLSRT